MNKIIQIMPAPEGMFAVYKDGDSEFACKIVCLGLTDDGGVVCMDITSGDGIIEEVQSAVRIEVNYVQ